MRAGLKGTRNTPEGRDIVPLVFPSVLTTDTRMLPVSIACLDFLTGNTFTCGVFRTVSADTVDGCTAEVRVDVPRFFVTDFFTRLRSSGFDLMLRFICTIRYFLRNNQESAFGSRHQSLNFEQILFIVNFYDS